MTGSKSTLRHRQRKGSTIPQPAFAGLFFGQAGVVLSVALALAIWSQAVALAFAAGALLHILPQTYLAIRAFRYRGAAQIQHTFISTNQGLVGKWLLFATGLALTFRFWTDVHLPALFIGYLLAQMGSWIVYPILINRPLRGK
jgi:F0F1-type ATP synthase assembly protein I